MSEILNLDILNPESRKITLTVAAGGYKLPVFLLKLLRLPKSKIIEIILPAPSFRLAQELAQKYILFVQASLDYAKNPLEATETAVKMQTMMLEIVVAALKPGLPSINREWVEQNLDDESFTKVFEFVVQPIQAKIRKNAETLQGLMMK